MADSLFSTSSVRGLALLDFLEWAHRSHEALRGEPSLAEADAGTSPTPDRPQPAFGLLALPPVQRSAVWRPKQVTDLWDSLFRGLPIGSFFLIARTGADTSVRAFASDDRITTVAREGFDLFDGQQRTRAMLLGLSGPALDGRCLWIDLAPGKRARIHMTSRSQPFGYDATTGQKLSRADRVQARAHLEATTGEIRVPDARGGTRPAYDHELFDHLFADSAHKGRLPLPFKASPDTTHRLDTLLAVWRAARREGQSGLDALERHLAPADEARPALHELDAAFARVARAEVALLRIDPHGFAGGREQEHESLLMLFDRIGAGGTPLSNDERLFSIFKHHDPRVHNAVLQIHAAVGRVMTPTKIVVTALRLANALSAPGTTGIPDVAAFARIMTGAAPEATAFREKLAALIPTAPADAVQAARAALLTRAFEAVRGLLEYAPADSPCGSPNPSGLPRVALVDLPAELWQVLLFWAVKHLQVGKTSGELAPARAEITRFAMFWRLCVYNEARAAAWSFSLLHKQAPDLTFPGAALYRMFVGDLDDERCANRLLPADVLRAHMVGTPSPIWRTFQERFVPEGAPRGYEQLGPAWWRGARRMLPWLQRGYVAAAFPAYDPLSNRDDDLPYDLDHLCPQSDWAADWRLVKDRIEEPEPLRGRMGGGRFELGNAIGNLRIIDAATNRGDGDAEILDKLPFLRDGMDDTEARRLMDAQAINPAHRDLWRDASGRNRRWDAARLQAFQEAVEQRSAWLYEQFFDTLGYAAWLTAERTPIDADPPHV